MYSVAWEDADINLDEWPQEFYDEGFDQEGSVEEEYGSQELWIFQTAMDDRVCGQCAPLEGVLFSRQDIMDQFPSADEFEDIIFANVHDNCRCQLIPQQQGGEGGEDVVEGRGEPLAYMMRGIRNPTGLVRLAARRGLRGALGAMGMTALAPFLIPMIFAIVLPLITSLVQQFTKQQVEAELKKQVREQEKKRAAEMNREVYRGVVSE